MKIYLLILLSILIFFFYIKYKNYNNIEYFLPSIISNCNNILFNNDGTFYCEGTNITYDPYDTSNLNNIDNYLGPNNLPIKSQNLRNNYKNCINNGFTKEFCLKNDMPNSCLCSNGTIGIYLTGQKGNCVCV